MHSSRWIWYYFISLLVIIADSNSTNTTLSTDVVQQQFGATTLAHKIDHTIIVSENANSDSFTFVILSNTQLISIILMVIAFCLLIICIILVIKVRKQNSDHKKAKECNKINKNIEMINMESATQKDIILHRTSFKNEENSYESRTSFNSQMTAEIPEFGANISNLTVNLRNEINGVFIKPHAVSIDVYNEEYDVDDIYIDNTDMYIDIV